MTFKFPEKYRLRNGPYGSTLEEHGLNGAAFIPYRPGKPPLKVIASNGDDMPPEDRWEHVSVSLPDRCPTWEEMCYVQGLFWGPEDTVMQLHPPRKDWVNNHPYCLHLWRPVNGQVIPAPPQYLVGDPSLGTLPLRTNQ